MKTAKVVIACLVLLASGDSVAADYTVRQADGKSGACYHNRKRVSNLRFCHNCRKSGGNYIVWKFDVYCEGKRTAKQVFAVLACERKIPEEGEQIRRLYDMAKEKMEDNLRFLASWRECDLGGWK